MSGTFALSRQRNVSHVHDSMKRALERRGEQWDSDMGWFNFDRQPVGPTPQLLQSEEYIPASDAPFRASLIK